MHKFMKASWVGKEILDLSSIKMPQENEGHSMEQCEIVCV